MACFKVKPIVFIQYFSENREIFEKDFNQASRDSMFSEMPSPCESVSALKNSILFIFYHNTRKYF